MSKEEIIDLIHYLEKEKANQSMSEEFSDGYDCAIFQIKLKYNLATFSSETINKPVSK